MTARLAGNVTMELTEDQVEPYAFPSDVFQNPDGTANDLSWVDPDFLIAADM